MADISESVPLVRSDRRDDGRNSQDLYPNGRLILSLRGKILIAIH